MAYATVQDMVNRYGELELVQLTDIDNVPPSVIDDARVETKLDDAQAVIDGYIGQVYVLPLRGCRKPATTPGGAIEYVPPTLLTRLSCDIARYFLYDDLAPDTEVYRRHRDAMTTLQTIASGEQQLACQWGGSPGDLVGSDAQTGDDVRYAFSPRVMTDENLDGYR